MNPSEMTDQQLDEAVAMEVMGWQRLRWCDFNGLDTRTDIAKYWITSDKKQTWVLAEADSIDFECHQDV